MSIPGSLGLGTHSFGPGDCPACGDVPPCIVTICGTVGGCGQFYLEGADVELTWDGGSVSRTTDADGRYCFPNPVLNPGDPDITISYVISYPGFVTATGTFNVGCQTPGTIGKIDLSVDDDHVCACSCTNPIPKVLNITTDKASGTLTWIGSNFWSGELDWFDSNASKPISGRSDINEPCSCCINDPGTVAGRFILGCDKRLDAYGVMRWMWTLAADFGTCLQRYYTGRMDLYTDCYKTPTWDPSNPFVPWCDSQGATEYQVARLMNIDYTSGHAGTGACAWSVSIALDCESTILDFNVAKTFPGYTCPDIPAIATITF